MRRIVLMGPPGAGKGTQGMRLARALRVPHLATGDMLRSAMSESAQSPLAQTARVIDRGNMVDDQTANDLVFGCLQGGDAQSGWVLDGYPRTVAQAEALWRFLQTRQETLDAVLVLTVRETVLRERLGGRLVCGKCAASFHVRTAPPYTEGLCDYCQSELFTRPDDSPVGIARRLHLYHERTAPLHQWWDKTGVLQIVQAEGDADAVFAACWGALCSSVACTGLGSLV